MARPNPFQAASRGTVPIRLLLGGRSGGGKTYSALALACHIAELSGQPGRVAVADTEDDSAKLYAPRLNGKRDPYLHACQCDECRGSGMRFQFDHMPMADHSPESYAQVIQDAVAWGYSALVIDSITHEWTGRGGILEQVDALKGDGKGRATDNAWASMTPRHNRFLQAIRACPIHLIATCRVKDDREGGGWKLIQRDQDGGPEYEFTFFGVMHNKSLTMNKTRAAEFEGQVYQRPGRALAEKLVEWSGVAWSPRSLADDVDEALRALPPEVARDREGRPLEARAIEATGGPAALKRALEWARAKAVEIQGTTVSVKTGTSVGQPPDPTTGAAPSPTTCGTGSSPSAPSAGSTPTASSSPSSAAGAEITGASVAPPPAAPTPGADGHAPAVLPPAAEPASGMKRPKRKQATLVPDLEPEPAEKGDPA